MGKHSSFDVLSGGILVFTGLYAFWLGWQRYRYGLMPDAWNEHIRVLAHVNLLNFLLRRRQQARLTPFQIRVVGVLYMLIATIGLITGASLILRTVTG